MCTEDESFNSISERKSSFIGLNLKGKDPESKDRVLRLNSLEVDKIEHWVSDETTNPYI